MRKVTPARIRVFLNIPYDPRPQFQTLCLAYIVGLVDLGLVPIVTLAIEEDARLNRIFSLIKGSRYSIHDLSCVDLDKTDPRTPRFNMPFELGLAVAWSKLYPKKHSFFAFEEKNHRGHKSTSDMKAHDFHIHDGTPKGVMRELRSAFERTTDRPSVPTMLKHFDIVHSQLAKIKQACGAESIFDASVFYDLVFVATKASRNERKRP